MHELSIDRIKSRIRIIVGIALALVAVLGFHSDDLPTHWSGLQLKHSTLTLALCLLIVTLTRFLLNNLDRLKAAQCTVDDQQAQLAIKAAQLDACDDAMLQVDEEGRLLHFNQALCRMTGYSQAELAGARLHDIEPPEFVLRIASNMRRLKERGQATFESAFLAKDGSVVPVEVCARMTRSEGRSVVLSMSRDITRRKRGELRERNRLKTLEQIATDGSLEELLTCVVNFVEQECRGALCSVLLADDSGTRLRHGAAPSLPEAYNQAVDGLLVRKGNGSCGSAAFLRRRVVVEELETHPYWKGFQPARDAGLKACWSEPVFSSSGTLLGTLAIYHMEPRLPGEEEILLIESAAHLAGIAIGRVRGDEKRRMLEEQLRHSQRIEAVGQLAAGVAHDFNNLLTPIIVYTDMLRRGIPEGHPQIRMVDAVRLAAQKASELTRKLLSFGRKQVLDRAALDLNEVIGSFLDIMRITVRESISVELRLSPGAAQLLADRGQLEQLLLNLLVNAQDAITGNGAIRVETGHLVLD
jgi:PAS domain S-box-containing protein